MIEDVELPPNCIVRRARSTDKWTVINLMLFGISINGNPILIAVIALFYALFLLNLSIIFVTKVFAKFDNWHFYIFDVIQVGLVALSFWHIIGEKLVLFRQRTKACFWLIESSGLVVCYGFISRRQTYSLLRLLYIVPAYRAQRLGSFLLKYIIENNNKPLYLFCQSNLIGFYERFGFISVSRKQLPLNIGFSFLPALMLNESFNLLSSPTQIADNTYVLLSNLIVRRARKSDRAKIGQLIFASSALNSILPFGVTSSLANSFMLIVLFVFPFFLMAVLAHTISTGLPIPIPLVGLLAASIIAILLLPICTLVFACFQMQNWRQFYLVESNDKLTAYARLSTHNQYSILHYLHFCLKSNLSREQLADELLQHLVIQTDRPIYLACEAELVDFYKRFGFVTIATSNLPSFLQFGANLNLKFGGGNLVLR